MQIFSASSKVNQNDFNFVGTVLCTWGLVIKFLMQTVCKLLVGVSYPQGTARFMVQKALFAFLSNLNSIDQTFRLLIFSGRPWPYGVLIK